MCSVNKQPVDWMTEELVKKFVSNYGCLKEDVRIDKYIITRASDKMLGFLADYWKIRVYFSSAENKKELSFFLKVVSKNASKANMVREMKLFEKEINFYSVIKNNIELAEIKPWSPKLISAHNEAIVFEDLNALGYKLKNRFETFDENHALEALKMLARFHACSIIYEQRKRMLLQKSYSINEEFSAYLDKGGFYATSVWFVQCMKGALAAIKWFSEYKYDDIISVIERRWQEIWSSGLDLSNSLPGHCNVICHRDLWNNNILFHYKTINDESVPDDCLMVDFQAVRCQPPAGDVMLLLYCNLDAKFREEHMDDFLRFYHQNLEMLLSEHGIKICDVLPLTNFLQSAEKQRLWALIVSACLLPQMWLNDDIITEIFCDTKQFNYIFTHDKASFIRKMIENNDQYKIKVMQIFEEIVDRYCIVKAT